MQGAFASLIKMSLFKHFAGKNQLPGLFVNGTLVANELRMNGTNASKVMVKITESHGGL